jgi:hypothetical protein
LKGIEMITALRRIATLATLAVLCATVTTATTVTVATAAATPITVQVQGTQTPIDEKKGLYQMHSTPGHTGLVGDWAFTTTVVLLNSPALFIATGTEKFAGCIDVNGDDKCQTTEPTGKLFFDYILWLRLDPTTKPATLIEGRCVHPITGGKGRFKGARGLLTMHDVPVGGQIRTTYRGTVVVNAVGSAAKEAASAGNAPAATGSRALPGRC